MKLVAKSTNGKMLKVGPNDTEAKWYFMTEEVMKTSSSFNIGDEVSIKTAVQSGSSFITEVVKAKASTPSTVKKLEPKTIATGAAPDVGVVTQKEGYLPKDEWVAKMKAEGKWKENGMERSPEINASIKKQAIMHAVSRAMISMQGIITPDNMEEISDKLYRKFEGLVG